MSITNTTQLSLFDTIKNIFLSDSTLSQKFNSNNILNFEPKPKSPQFPGFPYIVINLPKLESEQIVVNNTLIMKQHNVTILLVIEWDVRENHTSYANAIINSIESNQSEFTDNDYKLPVISLEDTVPETIDTTEVNTSTFNLVTGGMVQV